MKLFWTVVCAAVVLSIAVTARRVRVVQSVSRAAFTAAVRREAGTSCEPNSEDYEQRTDALRCQDDYLKAVEEEIAKSTCKNTQYTITEDYEYGPV